MENKKTVDQNPEQIVNPEENINAVEESAKTTDGLDEQGTENEGLKNEEETSKIEEEVPEVPEAEIKAEETPKTKDQVTKIEEETPEATEVSEVEVKTAETPKTGDQVSKVEEETPEATEVPEVEVKAEETPEIGDQVTKIEEETPEATEVSEVEVKTAETPKTGDQVSKVEEETPEATEVPEVEVKAEETPKTKDQVTKIEEETPEAAEVPEVEIKAEETSETKDQVSKIEEETPEATEVSEVEVKTAETPETGDKVTKIKEETPKATDDKEEEEEEVEEEVIEDLGAEELIIRLEELVLAEEIITIKTKVALIKVAFLRILKEEKQLALDKFIEEGGKKEDFKAEDSKLEKRFNKAFEIYRKNRIKFNEQQEKVKLVNLDKKKEILEKLKELIGSEETLKKTYDEFRTLQTEWKEIGMVPSGEVSNLWQSYHFLVEKFFDKVKINKELRDLDMKKNLELKVELCEKAEELLLETSIIKSFKQLQKFHEEWKSIGPVPQEQSDDIWERFKGATDKINERRREHYGKMQEDQEKNLLAKTGLCEQAEELLTSNPDSLNAWQNQTNKMNELFNVWRSIGRTPKRENTEIWDRFKGSMNTFFTNKKEFLGVIKQEQLNNYNLKIDLCVEAEAVKDSTDWKKTTQDLIRLQQEWKKLGPVPRKHADKIWKRFRAACDEFFNSKSSHFSSVHENEQVNLDKKKELIEKVKAHKYTDDKSKNLDILKDFQREWMEIGYVPMKDKEKVQKQFRETVDAKLDELKISSSEFSNASYATRMEAVKDSPDADRVYRKEISFLTVKINKLRDDVNLWENNLGFFANSKQADILKQEFEQKIEKARQELAAMEAKVKYLRKMASEG